MRAPVSYQLLEDMFGLVNGYDAPGAAMKAFPFYMSSEGVFLQSSTWKDFRIRSYDAYSRENCKYVVERACKRGEYEWSSRTRLAEYKFGNSKREMMSALKQLHDGIKPYVKQYVLENGNLVPEYQNIMLNKRTAYRGV